MLCPHCRCVVPLPAPSPAPAPSDLQGLAAREALPFDPPAPPAPLPPEDVSALASVGLEVVEHEASADPAPEAEATPSRPPPCGMNGCICPPSRSVHNCPLHGAMGTTL